MDSRLKWAYVACMYTRTYSAITATHTLNNRTHYIHTHTHTLQQQTHQSTLSKALLDVFVKLSSSIARSNSFSSNEHLHAIGNRSRFRLSVNMGSSFTPMMAEEANISNCTVFIDELVSLLSCDNERMGVKVCINMRYVLCDFQNKATKFTVLKTVKLAALYLFLYPCLLCLKWID